MADTKRQATPGDILRALAILLLPVVALTALFTRGPSDYPVKVIDWHPVLQQARSESPYPVLAPVGLPPAWRATSVSWVRTGEPALNGDPSPRNAWSLGFLSPDDLYVSLVQGDRQPERLIADTTRAGVPDGESRVGSGVWSRRLSPDGRTESLVLSTDKVTTVVASDGGYELLEAYVATLTAG